LRHFTPAAVTAIFTIIFNGDHYSCRVSSRSNGRHAFLFAVYACAVGDKKRILLIVVIMLCAIVIFNTERVQQRMFSGSGKISDVRWDNPDFITTGRSVFVDVLWPGVEQEPVWGNGFNSYRSVFTETGLERALPHNDWLKLWHDFGAMGMGLYALTMLLQIFFLTRIARRSTGAHRMLAYGAATAFVPYMLIMFTDNVVLYVQFFGNLHFALIGMVYGAVIGEEGYANA